MFPQRALLVCSVCPLRLKERARTVFAPCSRCVHLSVIVRIHANVGVLRETYRYTHSWVDLNPLRDLKCAIFAIISQTRKHAVLKPSDLEKQINSGKCRFWQVGTDRIKWKCILYFHRDCSDARIALFLGKWTREVGHAPIPYRLVIEADALSDESRLIAGNDYRT